MNKAQLQDDLIDCNAENLKLRELLKKAVLLLDYDVPEEDAYDHYIDSKSFVKKARKILK